MGKVAKSTAPEMVLGKAFLNPSQNPTVSPNTAFLLSFVTLYMDSGMSVQPRHRFFNPLPALSMAPLAISLPLSAYDKPVKDNTNEIISAAQNNFFIYSPPFTYFL